MTTSKPSLVSLFAGIGGIDKGFESVGFQTVAANELDPFASLSYLANASRFSKNRLIQGSISDTELVNGARIMELSGLQKGDLTVLAGGFPCQPFSIAGLRKGFDDSRGNVFWDIIRLASELSPQVIFLENVRNLESHDKGNTFNTILEALKGQVTGPSGEKLESGQYHVTHRVLNSLNFGVPQNRERIFIIAFKDKSAFDNFEAGLPAKGMLVSKLTPLTKYIDFDIPKDAKYYYDSQRPMYEEIRSSVTQTGIVYQWRRKYVRQNKNNVCPTLTANMGMGGHNVPIIRTSNGQIRKLTPEECLRLMGFKDFKRPEGMSDAKLYKQAGNAVVVDVISSLASLIKVSLKV